MFLSTKQRQELNQVMSSLETSNYVISTLREEMLNRQESKEHIQAYILTGALKLALEAKRALIDNDSSYDWVYFSWQLENCLDAVIALDEGRE